MIVSLQFYQFVKISTWKVFPSFDPPKLLETPSRCLANEVDPGSSNGKHTAKPSGFAGVAIVFCTSKFCRFVAMIYQSTQQVQKFDTRWDDETHWSEIKNHHANISSKPPNWGRNWPTQQQRWRLLTFREERCQVISSLCCGGVLQHLLHAGKVKHRRLPLVNWPMTLNRKIEFRTKKTFYILFWQFFLQMCQSQLDSWHLLIFRHFLAHFFQFLLWTSWNQLLHCGWNDGRNHGLL